MIKLFLSVSFCVIILGILMLMLPKDGYEKYAKVACGITTIAIVLSIIFNADIDISVSEDYSDINFSLASAKETALGQSVDIIEENISNELEMKYNRSFYCKTDKDLETIIITSYHDIDENELIDYVCHISDLGREKIIVRYN